MPGVALSASRTAGGGREAVVAIRQVMPSSTWVTAAQQYDNTIDQQTRYHEPRSVLPHARVLAANRQVHRQKFLGPTGARGWTDVT